MGANLPVVKRGQPRDPGIVRAERGVQQSIGSLAQARALLAFARDGGKIAGWSLLGSSVGLGLALALHLPQYELGLIGSMVGVGVYAIRWLQQFKSPQYEKLNDELRDLKALWIAKALTDEEYQEARKRILKRFKII